MKKFKNLEKISKNKKQLKEYLLDFKEEKSKEIEKKFIDDDFNCGVSVFRIKMKSIISMPKIGKDTIRYWTSRGWNEKESENLRTKRKYNPEKSPMNKKYWISKGLSEKDAEYNGRYTMILDGHHRLQKLINNKIKNISAYVLDLNDAPLEYQVMFK